MVPYTHTLCAAASEVSALLSLAGLELRPVLGVRDDAQALLSRRRAGAQLPRLLLDELLLLLDLGLGARLVVPLLVLGRGAEMAPLRHLGTRRVETALARQLLTGVTGVTGVTGGRGGLGAERSCAPIDHLLHLVPAQRQPRKEHDRHVLRRVALARHQLELAGEDAAAPAPPAWIATPATPAAPAAPTWVVALQAKLEALHLSSSIGGNRQQAITAITTYPRGAEAATLTERAPLTPAASSVKPVGEQGARLAPTLMQTLCQPSALTLCTGHATLESG